VDNKNFIPAIAMGLKSEFHLLMTLYLCRKWKGVPHAKEGQVLAWRTLNEMRSLPMPPADKPLIAALQNLL
jgi:8-oxo-dGTP diphosphatase